MSKHSKNDTVATKEVVRPADPWMTTWATRLGFPDLWQALSGPEMRVEEFRDDDSMVVRADLPGVDPDKDIDVTVKDGMLHIHAQRSEKSSREEDRSYRTEFRYGSFDRVVHLPAGATSTDVKASYRDGVLEVRVPMDDTAAEATKVEISRN